MRATPRQYAEEPISRRICEKSVKEHDEYFTWQTFKFSTCLSPGEPAKPSKYGGYSESRAWA
jgi:hypothetical protein